MEDPLSSWRLFWLLALAISVIDLAGLRSADLHTPRGIISIILLTVRCALPLFVVAFTASSLVRLWPGRVTRWLLANRRYVGLAFAFGMAWHLVFVGYSFSTSGVHLNRTIITLDLVGLAFLLALTMTSFRWAARHLSVRVWRRLHKTGVYVIWLLATYIYAESVRWGPDAVNVTALTILLAAWGVRVASMQASRQHRRGVLGSVHKAHDRPEHGRARHADDKEARQGRLEG